METQTVREMFETSTLQVASLIVVIIAVRWGWKMVKWVWLNPKRLERVLREQGLQANPYQLWIGDLWKMVKMQQQVKSIPMPPHSHDLAPRIDSFTHHMVKKYGKNSFMWLGPTPRLILVNLEQIKEMLNKNYDFTKRNINPIIKYIGSGVGTYDGHKWTKHRKIINPAFNLDKLKTMMPTFAQSCNDMIGEWEKILSSSNGTYEMDVWPWVKNLTKDVISRAAFGSSYEEGRQIFDLLTEQAELVMNNLQRYYIPFWRFVHAKDKRRMQQIDRKVEDLLKGIIEKKEKALKVGEAIKNDLLGILLESNRKEIESEGNNNKTGMSLQEVIYECKVFYVAGQETTSVLLVWTMMLLSRYPAWQTRAREEVLQVFGNKKPDFDGLSSLKIMTMILYEVLRLYPPAVWIERFAEKDMKLGNLLVPAGAQVFIPLLMLHHDQEIWGSDAKEFNPERFSKGISKAGTGTSVAFFPFGWGPRICIGQNFALLEAKMALALILQHFWFELSPAYSHAPSLVITLKPDHGVHVILHKHKLE